MVTRSIFWNGANVCDEVTVNGLVPVITPVELADPSPQLIVAV